MTDDVPRPDILHGLDIPDEIRADMLELISSAAGRVWNRPAIPRGQRSMMTIAMLTALGRNEELRIHIGMGLDNGLSRADVCEVIMHAAIYAGFPAAVNAFRLASDVFANHA
jgi:alkylhydroperoxidase/carboxymuconolactone decarboxylase family protein YurZ